MAASSCCICTHTQVKNGQFCLKDVDTSCDSVQNLTNPDLKNATCTEDKSANPCKKVPAGKCLNEPSDITSFKLSSIPGYSSSIISDAGPGTSDAGRVLDWKLNIDIPGLTFLAPYKDENEIIVPMFAQYVQAFQKLLIGISLIATAIMIMYGGFLYIISATGEKVREGKKILTDAIIGLIIVLGAIIILSNINPNTANMHALRLFAVKKENFTYVTDTEYQNITGQVPPSSSDAVNTAIEVAKEMHYPDLCIPWAIIMSESGGNLKGISHDEDVRSYWPVQASRNNFIVSNTKKSGAAAGFNSGNYPGAECRNGSAASDIKEKCLTVAKQAIFNDDSHGSAQIQAAISTGDDTLGLDPRFSHGFGHGATFTMKSKCKKPDGKTVTGQTLNGKCFSIADLMTARGSAEALMLFPGFYKKFNYQSGFETDPNFIFCNYMTGKPCTHKAGTIQLKHDFYQKCKSNPSLM